MLRNVEIKLLLFISMAVSIMFSTLLFVISPMCGAIGLIGFMLISVAFLSFTAHRYNQIKTLSQYMQEIYGGSRVLDIRENTEGELSILKNDIYKITVKLYEQTERIKGEKAFLAEALGDISHQLKTPLTGAIVTADLLGNKNLSPEKSAEFADKIRALLEKLNWLCATLLKLSRLDAGAISFSKTRLSIAELIKEAVKPLEITAEIKGVGLAIDVSEGIIWQGDEHWTVQAFTNIIKNCIEHTQSGGMVTIKAENTTINTKITITDNGGRIDEQDLPHIFERFYKGRRSSEDSAGIGLALSQSVLQKQGGMIEVSNFENKAVFTVYLNNLIV